MHLPQCPFLAGYFPAETDAGSEEDFAVMVGMEPGMKREEYYDRVGNMARAYAALSVVSTGCGSCRKR